MKRLLTIIAVFSLLAIPVAADQFNYTNNTDSYQGGYHTNTRSHWTSYGYNANVTVQATIKVKTYNTEVANGNGYAYIASAHGAGPYDSHQHGKAKFD